MWKNRHIRLLKQEIEILLTPLSDVSGLTCLVKEPLTEATRALSTKSTHDPPWIILPSIVCQSISGRYKRAISAAAALQLLVTAGDIFDDIEDADSPQSLSSKYGSSISNNIATILLILAEKAIARLKVNGVDTDTVVRVQDTINSYYTTACIGQHLDLSLSPIGNVTEDEYLKIVSMKSASQIECACYVGAILAKADQKLIDIFAAFGHNLGMAAQISNDILGILKGNDISRKKITLPIVYALTQADNYSLKQLHNLFDKPEYEPDPGQIKDLLLRTGSINYALVKAELFKQKALDFLTRAKRNGVNVERLKLFVN